MPSVPWLSTEQKFLHFRIMQDAKKTNHDELLEIFDNVHQQLLLKNKMFTSLVTWCARSGTMLPPITDLIDPDQVEKESC
jgi:hypothetical protein